MEMLVSRSSAPGGISMVAPVGLFSTAPAVPTVAFAVSRVTLAVALTTTLALFVTCSVYVVVELGETLMESPERASMAPGCTVPWPPVNTGTSVAVAPTAIGVLGAAVKLWMAGAATGCGGGFSFPPQAIETIRPENEAMQIARALLSVIIPLLPPGCGPTLASRYCAPRSRETRALTYYVKASQTVS